MTSVYEFRVVSPETWERPYEFFAALRREAPVFYSPELDAYIISRYDDIVQVEMQPEVFSSHIATTGARRKPTPEMREIISQMWRMVPTLLHADPPDHTRQRQVAQRAFARRLARMEPKVRALVNELIDSFIGEGQVEFVARFAIPLPVTVITAVFNFPTELIPKVKEWTDASLHRLGALVSEEEDVAMLRSLLDMQRYLFERIQERRARPVEGDLISEIVHAQPDGRPFSDEELIFMLQQLLVAGNDTTTRLLTHAMRILIEHPQEMAALYADPSLIPNFLEEVLRLEPSIRGLFRVTTRDTELHGVKIPAGSKVWLLWAAANRDESKFPDPDRFDMHRPNAREHLAFGYGIHHCLGAPLARLEARVAYEELLKRLRNLRFAEGNDFSHEPNILFNGLNALYIAFDAA